MNCCNFNLEDPQIIEVANTVLELPRGQLEIRSLVEKVAIEKRRETALLLAALFQGISGRTEKRILFSRVSAFQGSELTKSLKIALKILRPEHNGYERGAILQALGAINEKARDSVSRSLGLLGFNQESGHSLASLIRVIHAIPEEERCFVIQRSKKFLSKAVNGHHLAAILRALHTTKSENVLQNLARSVGDPEVERLFRDWDLTAQKISNIQIKQLKRIENFLEKDQIPPQLEEREISEEVGKGLFAKTSIKKGDVIGKYTGVLELVPADRGGGNYMHNIAASVEKLRFRLSPGQIDFVTLVDRDEEGLPDYTCLNRGYIIQLEGELMGNYTRSVNHGTANVESSLVKLPNGDLELIIVATDEIEPGQQILLNYGEDYWGSRGITPVEITPNTYRLVEGKIVQTVTRRQKRKKEEEEEFSTTDSKRRSVSTPSQRIHVTVDALSKKKLRSSKVKREPVYTERYREYLEIK